MGSWTKVLLSTCRGLRSLLGLLWSSAAGEDGRRRIVSTVQDRCLYYFRPNNSVLTSRCVSKSVFYVAMLTGNLSIGVLPYFCRYLEYFPVDWVLNDMSVSSSPPLGLPRLLRIGGRDNPDSNLSHRPVNMVGMQDVPSEITYNIAISLAYCVFL
jgi:hypothetical protein